MITISQNYKSNASTSRLSDSLCLENTSEYVQIYVKVLKIRWLVDCLALLSWQQQFPRNTHQRRRYFFVLWKKQTYFLWLHSPRMSLARTSAQISINHRRCRRADQRGQLWILCGALLTFLEQEVRPSLLGSLNDGESFPAGLTLEPRFAGNLFATSSGAFFSLGMTRSLIMKTFMSENL